MDSLILSFDTSTRVSFDEYDIYSKHPRYSQYKEKIRKSSQEARRQQYLQEQRERKIDAINFKRGIDELGVKKIEEELIKSEKTKPKIKRLFKDFLMLSEWLTDIPPDFKDWIVVPCPVGKRVLVVAERGVTKMYNRKGYRILHNFSSALPGGSSNHPTPITMIDCIWHHESNTLFILDIIWWGPWMTNCDAEFRFIWLSWKHSELKTELSLCSKYNKYRLVPLERFSCDKLAEFASKPYCPEDKNCILDGFIFFHKEGLYVENGRSPLVTWLKPFMLYDILEIPVHPDYMPSEPLSKMEIESSVQSESKPDAMTS